MDTRARWIGSCLAAVVAALLAVGVASGTPLRHAIQVAPAAAVLAANVRRAPWAGAAAAAVFAFWLLIMTLIWLWLLGLARVVTGKFTPIEIALTLVIGLASLAGLFAAARGPARARAPARAAAFAALALLQIAAMWLSLRPQVADR